MYQSSHLSQINAREYISDLATTVTNTLQAETREVDIQLNIAKMKMNINVIIPLGMLLNELLANSLKYAFQDQPQGLIAIDITQIQQSYKVVYQDNGRGFNQKDFEKPKSLGHTIVNMLLQQLQANYEIDTDGGFEIVFTFDTRESGSHTNM